MKPILTLYKELLSEFKKGKDGFICSVIENHFDNAETKVLKEHFYSQYPSKTQYTKFYNNKLFNKDYHFGVIGSWFSYYRADALGKYEFPYSEPFKLRVKLIEAIIEKLEVKEIKRFDDLFLFYIKKFGRKAFSLIISYNNVTHGK